MASLVYKFNIGDTVKIEVNGQPVIGKIDEVFSEWDAFNFDILKFMYNVKVGGELYRVEEKDIQPYSKQLLSQIEVTCPNGKTYLIVNVKKLENLANLEMWKATTSDGETVYISHNNISVMIIKDQPEEIQWAKQCQEIKEIRNEQT